MLRLSIPYLRHLLIVTAILVAACSPYKKGLLNTAFHNTTGHYNAEFIAKERLLDIENKVLDQQVWDYTRILPVFPQFDTTFSKSLESDIEECIKKASLVIQYHPNSKWVDNSYAIIGKARFYQSDFQNAIETFKYVNTKGEGDTEKHEALVALMRTFIESNEYNNAQAVSDYLKKEKLNKRNLKDLYLTRAYFEQERDNIEGCVKNLVLAEPLIDKKAEASRIRYTIGQIYQVLDENARSFVYYKRCLKGNPPYELTFFTKLNMAQVTTLSSTNEENKIRRYFKKLLKDSKNEEYKDKIYYDFAKYETRKGNLSAAVEKYQLSLKENKGNELQKSFSYLGLGKLYYDSLEDYVSASIYYDSALLTLPESEEIYTSVESRQKMLLEFRENYLKVQKNDSLLSLAEMDTAQLYALIDEEIALRKEQDLVAAKLEKRRNSSSSGFNQNISQNGGFNEITTTSTEGGTWYFYNPLALTTGFNNFQKIWGKRKLEDDWRRSSKEAVFEEESELAETTSQNEPVQIGNEEAGSSSTDEGDIDPAYQRDTYLKEIPYSPEAKASALKEVEDGLYNLGKLYNFHIGDQGKSITSFKAVVNRFDTSEYRPESLYILYTLYSDLNKTDSSEIYKDFLLTAYPDNIFAKLITNPNFREDYRKETKRLKQTYNIAYEYYEQKNYVRARSIIAESFKKYPENEFLDRLALLDAIIIGRTEPLHKYQYELNRFIADYQESSLLNYAKDLLNATETYKFNLVNSASARYQLPTDTSNYYFVILEPNVNNYFYEHVLDLIDDDYAELELKIATILLDEETKISTIKTFRLSESVAAFYDNCKSFQAGKTTAESSKFYYITEENFKILDETKDIEAYEKFFNETIHQP